MCVFVYEVQLLRKLNAKDKHGGKKSVHTFAEESDSKVATKNGKLFTQNGFETFRGRADERTSKFVGSCRPHICVGGPRYDIK